MVAPNDQTQKHKHLQTAANDKTHTKGEMQQKAHHSPKSFLRFLLLYVVLLFVGVAYCSCLFWNAFLRFVCVLAFVVFLELAFF